MSTRRRVHREISNRSHQAHSGADGFKPEGNLLELLATEVRAKPGEAMFNPCGILPRPTAPRKTRATEERSRGPLAPEGSSGPCQSRRRRGHRPPRRDRHTAGRRRMSGVETRAQDSPSCPCTSWTRLWGEAFPRTRPSMPMSEPARPHSPCAECIPSVLDPDLKPDERGDEGAQRACRHSPAGD